MAVPQMFKFLQHATKTLTVDKLHRQKVDSVSMSNTVDRNNVGVMQRSRNAGFPLESLDVIVARGNLPRQKF